MKAQGLPAAGPKGGGSVSSQDEGNNVPSLSSRPGTNPAKIRHADASSSVVYSRDSHDPTSMFSELTRAVTRHSFNSQGREILF